VAINAVITASSMDQRILQDVAGWITMILVVG